MNVVLSGMPGCGKTTVSALLAKELGYGLADTDKLIVDGHGEISKIFETYGEAYFRLLEHEIVESLSTKNRLVIATGGGCLMNHENVKLFKTNGKIVYLNTSVAELSRRLNGDTTRPLIKGDVEKNLKELYARRAHVYESAADFTVDCDGLTPERITKKITELIKL